MKFSYLQFKASRDRKNKRIFSLFSSEMVGIYLKNISCVSSKENQFHNSIRINSYVSIKKKWKLHNQKLNEMQYSEMQLAISIEAVIN